MRRCRRADANQRRLSLHSISNRAFVGARHTGDPSRIAARVRLATKDQSAPTGSANTPTEGGLGARHVGDPHCQVSAVGRLCKDRRARSWPRPTRRIRTASHDPDLDRPHGGLLQGTRWIWTVEIRPMSGAAFDCESHVDPCPRSPAWRAPTGAFVGLSLAESAGPEPSCPSPRRSRYRLPGPPRSTAARRGRSGTPDFS